MAGLMLGVLGIIVVLRDLLGSSQYGGSPSVAAYLIWIVGFAIVLYALWNGYDH